MDNSAAIALFGALVLLAAIALTLIWQNQENEEIGEIQILRPSIKLENSPVHEGEELRVEITLAPACKKESLSLFLDEKAVEFSLSSGSIHAILRPKEGVHKLRLEGGKDCSASEIFEVLAAKCKEGTTKSCIDSRGCEGKSICRSGVWGACIFPTPICKPGSKTACMINSCEWGFSVCNMCGTGWGPCMK
jgi:hypothetical protein